MFCGDAYAQGAFGGVGGAGGAGLDDGGYHRPSEASHQSAPCGVSVIFPPFLQRSSRLLRFYHGSEHSQLDVVNDDLLRASASQ